jgi:hypothetical protein
MGIFTYRIKVKCNNCGFKSDLIIRKGVTIKDFFKSPKCKCKECGCKIEPLVGENGKKYWEYETEWEK